MLPLGISTPRAGQLVAVEIGEQAPCYAKTSGCTKNSPIFRSPPASCAYYVTNSRLEAFQKPDLTSNPYSPASTDHTLKEQRVYSQVDRSTRKQAIQHQLGIQHFDAAKMVYSNVSPNILVASPECGTEGPNHSGGYRAYPGVMSKSLKSTYLHIYRR